MKILHIRKSPIINLLFTLFLALILKQISERYLEHGSVFVNWLAIFVIIGFGIVLIKKTAEIIEETTEALKHKTGLAGGMLQAFGTALPDMIIGITAAFLSLSVVKSDPVLAFGYALIATSATFGSNIYNIGHAAWCIYRQNKACRLNKPLKMFPVIGFGTVQPMSSHDHKPYIFEINTAIRLLTALTFVTTLIVFAMVAFGRVPNPLQNGQMAEDVYQLTKPLGLVILIISLAIVFFFRKDYGKTIHNTENMFFKHHQLIAWLFLFLAGAAIFVGAESMVHSVSRFSELANVPVVIAGILAGIIGCLGEMLVIHNFTVHPKGRIGDAVVGIAMDNLFTTIGASFVAVLGGIFLGGSALIFIFVLILMLNTALIWQVSELKDEYVREELLSAHIEGK
jgi:Ca2+/Na+ antiporter